MGGPEPSTPAQYFGDAGYDDSGEEPPEAKLDGLGGMDDCIEALDE